MNKRIFRDLKKSIQKARDIQSGKVRPRRTWEINPKTKVKENAKGYYRAKEKRNFKKQIESEF